MPQSGGLLFGRQQRQTAPEGSVADRNRDVLFGVEPIYRADSFQSHAERLLVAVAARRVVVLDQEAFALGADADVQRVAARDAVVLHGILDQRLEAHRGNPPVAQRGVDGRGEFDAVVEADFLKRVVLPREVDLLGERREYLLAAFQHPAVDAREG